MCEYNRLLIQQQIRLFLQDNKCHHRLRLQPCAGHYCLKSQGLLLVRTPQVLHSRTPRRAYQSAVREASYCGRCSRKRFLLQAVQIRAELSLYLRYLILLLSVLLKEFLRVFRYPKLLCLTIQCSNRFAVRYSLCRSPSTL